jgi:L-threonylcarbamoyladenylate synthase
VLLRPGTLTRAQIEAACGERLWLPQERPGAGPRASGTLASHYAPSAKVRLMDAASMQTALDLLGADATTIAVYARSALRTRAVHYRRMPDDARETARQLFAVLRDFDRAGVKLIWVETPPDTPEWDGVRDRLQRAAA